jgi:hypothetical protein
MMAKLEAESGAPTASSLRQKIVLLVFFLQKCFPINWECLGDRTVDRDLGLLSVG